MLLVLLDSLFEVQVRLLYSLVDNTSTEPERITRYRPQHTRPAKASTSLSPYNTNTRNKFSISQLPYHTFKQSRFVSRKVSINFIVFKLKGSKAVACSVGCSR